MEPPLAKVTLLPELLKELGYRTSLVGKLHWIPDRKAHPSGHPKVGHGLDHFYGFVGGWTGYFNRSRSWQRNGERFQEEGYTTHLISREAAAVIAAHAASHPLDPAAAAAVAQSGRLASKHAPVAPLFLWVSWTAPHRPMEAVAEDEAVYPQTLHPRLRTYGAMVTALDSGVQMVVGALRRRAMLLDSLVLFLSDNGGPIQRESCNGGLRGGKGTAYEGGVRVPAFALWPGCLRASSTDVPFAMMDIFPTIVAAALSPLPPARAAEAARAREALAALAVRQQPADDEEGEGQTREANEEAEVAPVGAAATANVREGGAVSWWDAMAGLCAEDGCGVGPRRRRERRRRGSGRGDAARLMVIELSAATAGVLWRSYKLVATARRCLDLYGRADGPRAPLDNAEMVALIKRMESTKDGGMEGPKADALIGEHASARAEGATGSGSGIAFELFHLRRDPCEQRNLLEDDAWRGANASAARRGVLRVLHRGLARAALRAARALQRTHAAAHRRRPMPRLRHWFCFQPFKASALDWPVIHQHHTCLQRTPAEHFGSLNVST